MKKTVGIIGALAILLGCFVNLAFATDVNMIPYEGTAKMEKVEITSETSVRFAEDEMPFFSRESESVRLTDLESKVLKDTQLIVNDVLKGARATGSITWDIPAGATGKGKTSFSLEAGEGVTINCSYSPRSASVDFGLIAPNGRYYYMAGKNGSVNREIVVDERGEYYLAICNNSDNLVSVYGFVNY